VRAIPLHLTAHGVLATTAGTAVTAGAIYGGPKVVEKLSKSFAEGFICQVAKNERKGRVDMRNIRDWFTKNAQDARRALMFTATGKIDGIYFRAAPASGEPCTILQGYFDPVNGRMMAGRIMNDTPLVSDTVLRNHRATGIAVYGQASA
jgi:hypothetical protein